MSELLISIVGIALGCVAGVFVVACIEAGRFVERCRQHQAEELAGDGESREATQ